jgi:steroid delta-isomerase-like uncharacterized protein
MDHQTMTNAAAFDIVADYIEALTQRNHAQMDQLRSADFVLDFVHGDAFADRPLSDAQTRDFWPAWFDGFPEMDFEVTRAIAGADVIVAQWTFTGTQSGPLNPPIFAKARPASGRTVRFRGVSIYDVQDGFIHRETTYMDLTTLLVEVGGSL